MHRTLHAAGAVAPNIAYRNRNRSPAAGPGQKWPGDPRCAITRCLFLLEFFGVAASTTNGARGEPVDLQHCPRPRFECLAQRREFLERPEHQSRTSPRQTLLNGIGYGILMNSDGIVVNHVCARRRARLISAPAQPRRVDGHLGRLAV